MALFFLVCDLLLEGWSSNAFVDALLLIGGFVLVEALRVTAQWHWFWWVLQVPEYPLFPKPFRLFGVLSSPNLLAGQLILILPFAILKFGRARSSVGALVWGCWLLAADVVLFLTSCRGGWVATIVEVAICVGWLACRRECIREENAVGWIVERWRIWVAVATYVGLFGLLQILSSSASPLPIASHDNFSPQEPAGRIAIWAVAWQDFLSHPLVGSGPGTYPWILVSQTATSSGGVASPHSHNIFLEALAEQGVLGMIALVWGLLAAASTLGPALLRAVRTNRDAGSADSQLVVGVSADLASLQR
ncbi:MAG TPA: O-antigen ligase family protein [Chloroflexota bacterium]|nr:O-antigen ligase family protein [Chloroflexota bacterium]